MNDYFCMAPFSHIQINAFGEINPCCMFNERIYHNEYNSLTDAFIGEENKILRNKMINNEYIDGCQKCYRDEKLGKKSYRKRFNNRYLNDENILNPTIKELEIALGNKCNLKCVDCNTKFSSAWYNDDLLLKRNYYTYKGQTLKNNVELDGSLLNLKELKILGGEPFLDNRYLDLFDKIKNKEDVTLFFVTNNSIFPNENWINEFNKFKKIIFNISIDGIENVAEFVRYGIKFSKFEKNYKKWMDLNLTNIEIIPHFVFHNYNILNFSDTIHWLMKLYNVSLNTMLQKLSYDFLDQPEYLNCSYLSSAAKIHILNQVSEFSNTLMYEKINNFLYSNEMNSQYITKFLEYTTFLQMRSDIPKESMELYTILKQEKYE